MKLIITQPEIEAIVRAHVESTVQLREGADMKIDFTATRSDDGIVATIDIPYMGVAGIPAIAAAAEAQAQTPVVAAKAAPTTRAKPVAKGNAGSILGGGTTAATEPAKNPEPVTTDAAAEAAPETAQNAAGEAQADEGTDAQAETAEAAQADAGAAGEAAPAPSRGPSLFGSAFKL